MEDYHSYFKNKKITVMGLGLLGRGLGDIKFLAEEGAELVVTDLKSATDLKPSLDELKNFPNITYVLGEHRLRDFRDRDFILKAAGVPLDSPFVAEARKNNIPIEMSSALFAKLTPATIVGITGTRGKSTVTHLIYEIVKKSFEGTARKVFLGGNVKGIATLPLLREAKENDIALLELDSWQLQGFGESKISPHVSVFTTFLADHQNYYKGDMQKYFNDKANIFKYQTENDYLVLGENVHGTIVEKYGNDIKSKIVVAKYKNMPQDWVIQIPGEHNQYNVAIACEVAKILGIDVDIARGVIEDFKGIPGRLELIKTVRGINIYNDTTATTPDATLAGLRALSKDKNVVLIMGGADKMLDMTKLVENLENYCKVVVLLPGTGTDKLTSNLKSKISKIIETKTLQEAVNAAMNLAQEGDVVLLSPAFASFGLFKNEFDRGEQFNKILMDI